MMAPEEAARLNRRTELLLATADELLQSDEDALESLSFGDLQASSADEESVDVPRFDED